MDVFHHSIHKKMMFGGPAPQFQVAPGEISGNSAKSMGNSPMNLNGYVG